MDTILRAVVLYFFLLLLFRLAGKRTFGQATPFDFVLLLIIGESAQQGLTGQDYSLTNAMILIASLLAITTVMSFIKQSSPRADHWIDGAPLILIDNGELLKDRMNWSRVSQSDILHAARQLQGLERLDQIKYAVLEVDGGITVIPKS